MRTLADLPSHWRDEAVLEQMIRHETAPGTHTYHACGCAMKQATRSGVCEHCLRGALAELRAGVKGPVRLKMSEEEDLNCQRMSQHLFFDGARTSQANMAKEMENNA